MKKAKRNILKRMPCLDDSGKRMKGFVTEVQSWDNRKWKEEIEKNNHFPDENTYMPLPPNRN